MFKMQQKKWYWTKQNMTVLLRLLKSYAGYHLGSGSSIRHLTLVYKSPKGNSLKYLQDLLHEYQLGREVYNLVIYQELHLQNQSPSVIHLQTGVLAWQVQKYRTIYHTLLELSITLIPSRQNLRPICLMRHLTSWNTFKLSFYILCFYHT